jgi:hypothetical protein
MNREAFFLKAMEAECFRRLPWLIAAFAVTRPDPEAATKDRYPYRIIQTPTGAFYCDPEKNLDLSPIEGTKPGEPPFDYTAKISLKPGDLPNVRKPIDTRYGNVVVNCVALIWPFGNKLEFMTGRISARQIEGKIAPVLQDTPPEGAARDPKVIYVDEYLRFTEGMFFLTGLSQVCTPGASEKSMTPPPGIEELKEKLLKENEDRLRDPAVIAAIDAKLIAHDAEYLKGDRSEGFLITKKSREIVRRKLFLMLGAETGLSESVAVELNKNSLVQGWDINNFPQLNNVQRAGSFNRGQQTMLGGVAVKELLRASSNLQAVKEDCGTALGLPLELTGSNYKRYLGLTIQGPNGGEALTEDNKGTYIGKRVLRRSPVTCSKLSKGDYCFKCIGSRLAANPTALSSAVAAQGSAFLAIFMALAHGKSLVLAKMDYQTALF